MPVHMDSCSLKKTTLIEWVGREGFGHSMGALEGTPAVWCPGITAAKT